ncbi:MAG: glycosyltransferase family 4 protein [Ornithinibacter sp.]
MSDTYAPTVGGIEVFVHDLAHHQIAQGHHVTVLTRTPSAPSEQHDGVAVVRDRRRVGSLVDDADAVHVHVSALSPWAVRAAVDAARHGTPVVATVHSMWTDMWPIARVVGSTRGWDTLPIQWAAVSSAAAEPVRRAVRRPVMVLPNAVQSADWLPGERRRRDGVTIVAVLRMARRKRPLHLVSLLARARRLVPPDVPMRAVLVGDGPLRVAVDRAIRRSGLDWVETVGALTRAEIAQVYRSADVFVAPATMESFGIAALEARTAGLAVLARSGTGVEEFVRHGVDGLLVDGDAAMADALAQLCTEPATLDRIRAHNAHHVPKFDWADALWRNEMAYSAAAALVVRPSRAGGVRLAQGGLSLHDLAFEP